MENNRPGNMPDAPSSVMMQRRTNGMLLARPKYAAMQVKIVTVRKQFGYETGIGIRGMVVASKQVSLTEAQKMIKKVSNRWGKAVTKKIPNIGLDVIESAKEFMDDIDYDVIDRKMASHQHEIKSDPVNVIKPAKKAEPASPPILDEW